jgi:hypothetical protein
VRLFLAPLGLPRSLPVLMPIVLIPLDIKLGATPSQDGGRRATESFFMRRMLRFHHGWNGLMGTPGEAVRGAQNSAGPGSLWVFSIPFPYISLNLSN